MKNKEEREASIRNKLKEKLPIEEIKKRKKNKIDLIICLIYAFLIQIYFVILDKTSKVVAVTIFSGYLKIAYMIFTFLAIIMFEIAYKKQKKNFIITGAEIILLAIHTLLLTSDKNQINILYNSFIWPIYYFLKAIIIYTIENKRRLKQISDISEIVKEEKPIKKVAKKRKT